MSSYTSSEEQADKWNKRYALSNDPGPEAPVLSQFKQLIPKQGNALDLACGLGGNSLYLSSLGLNTQAWDISSIALSHLKRFAEHRHLPITTIVRDIEKKPPMKNSFDLIVVSYFLYRPICNAIFDALKPGGVLFYQTYIQDKKSNKGPKSEDFLLQRNELLTLFPKLSILAYQEIGTYPQRSLNVSNELDPDTTMMVGQKPPHI